MHGVMYGVVYRGRIGGARKIRRCRSAGAPGLSAMDSRLGGRLSSRGGCLYSCLRRRLPVVRRGLPPFCFNIGEDFIQGKVVPGVLRPFILLFSSIVQVHSRTSYQDCRRADRP
ncbi:MAG: hypothetical protein ACLSB9_22745 [Hydrogeniiclostridium mannosilyticum]